MTTGCVKNNTSGTRDGWLFFPVRRAKAVVAWREQKEFFSWLLEKKYNL